MKIIVANWKMNHDFDKADEWLDVFFNNYATNLEAMKNIVPVVCPPFILIDHLDGELINDSFQYLEEILKAEGKTIEDYSPQQINEILFDLRPFMIGAQDCHFETSGSFTGNISANMIKSVGCNHVILGHSERRSGNFESDEIISRKVAAAVKEEITPILCIGESKEVRDAGNHVQFVTKQLMASLPQNIAFKKLIVAYEPIWSIGTGVTPTTEQIQEMATAIRNVFASNLAAKCEEFFTLYGGSVTAENSAEILSIENVDGLLVGKASLDAQEFFKICLSASQPKN